MTDTQEGNKMIAEFMGLKPFNDSRYGEMYFNPLGRLSGGDIFGAAGLKYHSSWDWLMPVVEKIVTLGWQFQLNSYGVSNAAMFINGESKIQNTAWSTPLLATYNVTVDFIKWHNKNNQP